MAHAVRGISACIRLGDLTLGRRYLSIFLSARWRFAILILLFWPAVCLKTAHAVPACPAGAEVKQPDGTAITVFLHGDEHAHWNESKDGYLITKDQKSGDWVYTVEDAGKAGIHAVGKADPKAIGALKVNKQKVSQQSASNRAQQSALAQGPVLTPHTGTMYNLVILVNFSDLTVAYPRQSYDDLFNQIGYTADGAVGSVKDYYRQVSYNALTVQSTVVEAVTLDYGYAYYGANVAGNDIRPREMVQEALAKLEARGFDFRTVDGDADGWVDCLTIIHAGGGEEYSGNDTNYIWSHKWQLSSPVTYDGVSMQTYQTEPARRGFDSSPSSQGITRIGVICHESGHFLGLPDLYDTGYDSEGAGNFCLMAGGSWNGDYGTTPAHMSAWCKSTLGWVTPTVISASGVYPLSQVETNTQIYKLQGPFPSTQYFLVENRQGNGFDAALPGSLRGVLIWHIDETQANNDNQSHYKVDLEEASGTQHLELNQNAGNDADYFRSGSVTTFTGSTTPNNLSYTGQVLGLDITNVSATGTSMSITVGVPPTISSISPNTGMSGNVVDITDLAGTGFVNGASVSLKLAGQADIAATNVTVVSATKITCTFSLSGAATGVWNVEVRNPDAQTATLNNGFTTLGQVFLTEGFESPFVDGAPPGWSKAFQISTVDWVRNVGDHITSGSHGGTYNAMLFYANSSDHQTYLITPPINFGPGTQSATLEFWHKQAFWGGDQDTLTVYYKTSAGGSWTLLSSYTTAVTTWTKRTIPLPNLSSTYYVGFLGNAKYGYGVCIDDVNVTGIMVSFSCTITASAGPNGSISPSGTFTKTSGQSQQFDATPDSGYSVDTWYLDGNPVQTGGTAYALNNIQADHTVLVTFKIPQITASAGPNGSISPSGTFTVGYGLNQEFNAAAGSGYMVDKWYLDGNLIQTGGSTYTLYNIQANHTVSVTFKIAPFSIIASAGSNGTISPSGTFYVEYDQAQQFTAAPYTGYMVDKWSLDGSNVQTGGLTYTLNNIRANHTVHVTFKMPQITASAGPNGTITPSGVFTITGGQNQQFIAAGNPGWTADKWYLDSVLVQTGGTTYTLYNIQSDHSVNVTFRLPMEVYVDANNIAGPWNGSLAHPYLHIQDGLSNAGDGDIVIVAHGTYRGTGNVDLDFSGKAVTLESDAGPASCIIDCNAHLGNPHRGFNFHSGEDGNSVLDGFTIKNAYDDDGSGALGSIYCVGSSPVIRDCILKNNAGVVGGIYSSNSYPAITGCIITSNNCPDGIGGVYIEGGSATISSCIITSNTGYTGGIFVTSGHLTLINSTIARNTGTTDSAGGLYTDSSTTAITNSIVRENIPSEVVSWTGKPVVNYCDLHSDTQTSYLTLGQGIIYTDPLFADPNNGNYHLRQGSPCINTGDPSFTPEANAVDIDYQPRKVGGRVDIGADEYVSIGDFNYNGRVNMADLAIFSSSWRRTDCTQTNNWCTLSDIDQNGKVNFVDLMKFAQHWLEGTP